MKFRRLEIHNIASIAHAEIDFEAQPLADSEVFLITGKTGAGKSTILDAICLALYNNTPRLHSSVREKDTLSDASAAISFDSTAQLLRRNEGIAWVLLTFTGNDAIDYRAEWHIQRAHKKPTGKMQKVELLLTNLQSDETVKGKEASRLIVEQAVGLTFDQFCRTTMLAQGEFTKFLKSDEKEKSDILEKITGVDVYSRIGMKIHEMLREKKQELQRQRDKADGKRCLTDEELLTFEAKRKQMEADAKNLDKQKSVLEAKHAYLRAETELVQKERAAQERLALARQHIDSDDLKRQSQLVVRWNETLEVRAALQRQREEEHQVGQAEQDLTRLGQDYAQLRAVLHAQQQQLIQQRLSEQQLTSALAQQQPYATVFAQHQTLESQLDSLIADRQMIAQNQQEELRLTKWLEGELTQKRQTSTADWKRQQELLAKSVANVKQQEEELALLRLPQLNTENALLVKREQQLQSAADKWASLLQARKARADEQHLLREKENQIHELTNQHAQLATNLDRAETLRTERQRVLDLVEAQTKSWALALREKLHVGDVCPVCFQAITAAPHTDGPIDSLYAEARQRASEAIAEHERLQKLHATSSANLLAEQKALAARQERFQADHSLPQAEAQSLDALRLVGIAPEQAPGEIDKQLNATRQQLQSLGERIAQGNQLQGLLDAARKNQQQLQQHLDHAKQQLDKAEQAYQKCQGELATARQLIANYRQSAQSIEAALQPLLQPAMGWGIAWQTDPQTFKNRLHDDALRFERQTKEQEALSLAITRADELVRRVDGKLTSMLEQCPKWSVLSSQQQSFMGNMDEAADALALQVAQALANRQLHAEGARSQQRLVDTFLQDNPAYDMPLLQSLAAHDKATIDAAAKAQKQAEDDLKQCLTLVQSATKELAAHREQRPSLTDDDTIAALTDQLVVLNAQASELQRQIGALTQQLVDDARQRSLLAALLQEIEQAQKEVNRWERLHNYFGDERGNKFRTIAGSYVLAQLIHAANAYMAQLSARYRLFITPGSYAIYIEDAYQGFVRRPASTISGGESFLVSLALALALSDIDQKQSSDILFIDEGFGTLSGEPLVQAIATLRALHSTARRRVGIISHVDELREKLSVQIQVDQRGQNSRSTVSVVKK